MGKWLRLDEEERSISPRRMIARQKRRRRRIRRILILAGLLVWGLWLAWTFISPLKKHPPAKNAPPATATTPVIVITPSPQTNSMADAIVIWGQEDNQRQFAEDLIQRGHYYEAEKILKAATEKNPRRLSFLSLLAEVYARQKKYEQSIALLLEVLAADPGRLPDRVLLARNQFEAGHPNDAIVAADWVLKDQSDHVEAHRIAALSLQETGQSQKSLVHWRKIVELQPMDLDAQLRVGALLTEAGDYARAADLYTEILSRNDIRQSEVYYNLALCHVRNKKQADAEAVLGQAVSMLGAPTVEEWLTGEDFKGLNSDAVFHGRNKQPVKTERSKSAKTKASSFDAGFRLDTLLPERSPLQRR